MASQPQSQFSYMGSDGSKAKELNPTFSGRNNGATIRPEEEGGKLPTTSQVLTFSSMYQYN